ncbi:DUF4129 domain-containing protein [Mucilaginibacter sp.]|uniref:DUF4129 domain-containing protein n=1 Tax=Mucilaginibacter sp. TaxID=1882438 RepID=UPI0032666DE3
MLRTTLLFVFLLIANLCFAGPDTAAVLKKAVVKKDTVVRSKKPAVIITDTTTLEQRSLDTAALNKYKKLPEFKYEETYNGPSWWTRFWRWFWEWLSQLLGRAGKHPGALSAFFVFLKYFFILAGVSALVFLILKLSGINMLHLFRKKPYSTLAYSESVENIHEIDFEAEIEKAIAVHNYRFAVRLLYLRSLKQLSDNGLINWQINKTNTNYVYELSNAEQREAFKRLTLQFEYVWYGDFLINGEIFKRINALFNTFKSSAE